MSTSIFDVDSLGIDEELFGSQKRPNAFGFHAMFDNDDSTADSDVEDGDEFESSSDTDSDDASGSGIEFKCQACNMRHWSHHKHTTAELLCMQEKFPSHTFAPVGRLTFCCRWVTPGHPKKIRRIAKFLVDQVPPEARGRTTAHRQRKRNAQGEHAMYTPTTTASHSQRSQRRRMARTQSSTDDSNAPSSAPVLKTSPPIESVLRDRQRIHNNLADALMSLRARLAVLQTIVGNDSTIDTALVPHSVAMSAGQPTCIVTNLETVSSPAEQQ